MLNKHVCNYLSVVLHDIHIYFCFNILYYFVYFVLYYLNNRAQFYTVMCNVGGILARSIHGYSFQP